MITKEEAIDHLKNIKIYSFQDGYTDEAREALDMAVKALEAQEWIPCSERLPEVGRSVLFSRRSMYTREGCLQADGKWWQYWWDEMLNADQVIAWMPLPEPYREEDTDVNVKS